jgi:uncharacterized protein DUF2017
VSWRGPVQPMRGGGYRLRVGKAEREALRGLCVELRELIVADDAAVARLFPAAYRDDPEASAEYDRLVRDDLAAGRLDALATVEATLEADRLDEAGLAAWCGALNDLRLVLGERLGVTEDLYVDGIDPTDPQAPELALYGWLTWLQSEVVEALASRL